MVPWILGGIAAVVIAAIIKLWPQILDWAQKTAVPFLAKIHPKLGELATETLVMANKVVGAARRTLKQAWQKLRNVLLSVVEEFIKVDSSTFRRITTAYAAAEDSTQVNRRIEEEELSYDDLPQEIQEELIRRGKVAPIDVTKKQDSDIMSMSA